MTSCLRFGDWLYDGAARELRGSSGIVHVSPKAFDLLGALLESRPLPLSKSELRDRLWTSTVVGDSNLASLVREIRKALGDTARPPVLVRTVHRFGYAFCGHAVEAARAAGPASAGSRCHLLWDRRHPLVLTDGENIIGRGPDASPRIGSNTVSRHHARLLLSPHGATIEDLGSKNGTYVRGEPLSGPTSLTDGDEIRLGGVRLTFHLAPAEGSTESDVRPPQDA